MPGASGTYAESFLVAARGALRPAGPDLTIPAAAGVPALPGRAAVLPVLRAVAQPQAAVVLWLCAG